MEKQVRFYKILGHTKKMGRRVTNGQYQYHINTECNKRNVKKRLVALEKLDTSLSKLTIRSLSLDTMKKHIQLCTDSSTVMNVNGKWIKNNSTYLWACIKVIIGISQCVSGSTISNWHPFLTKSFGKFVVWVASQQKSTCIMVVLR